MKKPKEPKESAKVKVDIKALKKLLKKINIKSSVVGVIGIVVLMGLLSSTKNYTDVNINPSGAQVVPPVASPASPPSGSEPHMACPYTCRFDPGEELICNAKGQSNPAIYEDILVWEDGRDDPPGGGSINSLYIKDLADPDYPATGTKLTDNYQGEYAPDIYENIIVWKDYRNGYLNGDIYMFDLEAGTETAITHAPLDQANPKIWGDWIVWEDDRNDDFSHNNKMTNIYAYNLTTGEERQITNTLLEAEIMPEIWNNLVVFGAEDDGGHRLQKFMVYNLDTGEFNTYPISKGTLSDMPKIHSSKIFWIQRQDVNNEYYLYILDLNTSWWRGVLSSDKSMYSLAIYNNKVVWEGMTESRNSDIYLYDTLTEEVTQITTNSSNQVQPAIYNNRIAWMDWRNYIPMQPWYNCPANSDIFWKNID